MTNKNDKRPDKGREIAQAALDRFNQKGFAATSLEQIAAAAGIGKSTVYEYYRNKEELFVAAVLEASEQWVEGLSAIGQQTQDTVERLYRIADFYLECGEPDSRDENRLFFEVLMQTIMEGGVFFKRRHLIRDIHRGMVRIIVDYLLAGVSRGELRPDIARDAEKIAMNLLAYLDGIQLQRMIGDHHVDGRKQVQFFMNSLVPLLVPEETGEGADEAS